MFGGLFSVGGCLSSGERAGCPRGCRNPTPGGDARILCARTESEQAKARHQHHAGQGIVHRGAVCARLLAREIGRVFLHESARGLLHGIFEIVKFAPFRRRHDQRPGLGANHMIGRDQAGARVARNVLAADVV